MRLEIRLNDDHKEYDFNSIQSCKVELNEGEVIRLPQPNELLIDIDSEESLKNFEATFAKFDLHVMRILTVVRYPSRSGGTGLPQEHVVLTLERDITPTERVMFQAFLGSDPMRELLSYVRILNDDPGPTLFVDREIV